MVTPPDPNPPAQTPDDRALVRRYQAGDRAACDALLARHRDRLYRLATAWLFNSADAEDVVQEVFVRALRGLEAFRFEAEPFSWFYRTCRLVSHEFNRKRTHEPLDIEPAATSAGPHGAAERDELAQRLHEALATLSEAQRDVVLLRDFEGLAVRATAAVLGVSEGTVKTLHFRARKRLRARLAE